MSSDQKSVGYMLSARDTVATLPWGGRKGVRVSLRGVLPEGLEAIELSEDIAPGHKVSLAEIKAGQPVIKYGLPIGKARSDISEGAHVHVHNVVSRLSPPDPAAQDNAERILRIRHEDLFDALHAIFVSAGATDAAARDVASHCVSAEARGVVTHGVRRVPALVTRLKAGGIDGTASPTIKQSGSVLLVDGHNGIGHHVARVAADALIEAARASGIAAALVRNSSHFGYAGYYATLMAKAGMVGVAVSNGQVLVGPSGARKAIFSNNPFALSAPVGHERTFEFDMATSVTSRARIAAAAEKGGRIPAGLALDREGRPTEDPAKALEGLLLPMGGDKGFGFIAALEILTGILPGGAYADQVVSKEASPDQPEGTSHYLMAIAPAAFGSDETFRTRMIDLEDRITHLPMLDGCSPARLPGARREAQAAQSARDGIPLERMTFNNLKALAEAAGCPLRLMPGDAA